MIEIIKGKEFGSLELIRQLTSVDGFIYIFENNLKEGNSLKTAYEKTEELHELFIGKRRYSCYDSFRHVRIRKIFHRP